MEIIVLYFLVSLIVSCVCSVARNPGDVIWPDKPISEGRPDVPDWIAERPYCLKCLEVVKPLCVLRGHGHCHEFLQVTGTELCIRLNIFDICSEIISNKIQANENIKQNRASVNSLCRDLGLC